MDRIENSLKKPETFWANQPGSIVIEIIEFDPEGLETHSLLQKNSVNVDYVHRCNLTFLVSFQFDFNLHELCYL